MNNVIAYFWTEYVFSNLRFYDSITCRCDTSGHGLAGMVVLAWRLDLMILEVFSNL